MPITKVIVITGAAGAIGKATALKFAAYGFNLCLVDIKQKELEQLGSFINSTFNRQPLTIDGDLADHAFIDRIITEIRVKWGRIDVVVNNAAWRSIESMRTISRYNWERTLNICLTAPAFLARNAAAVMEEKGIAGCIVNVSSIMSCRAAGNSPAYISAKGALNSLTAELAVTYGRKGIRVVGISPGFIETDLSYDYKNSDGKNISKEIRSYILGATPLGVGGNPDEVAEAIHWLSSPNAGYISGSNLIIDGGLTSNLTDYSLKNLQFPHEY